MAGDFDESLDTGTATCGEAMRLRPEVVCTMHAGHTGWHQHGAFAWSRDDEKTVTVERHGAEDDDVAPE